MPLSRPERRVLVALTLGSARLSREEISDPGLRWAELGTVAARHGVAPLVYRGLRALGPVETLPEAAGQLRERCRALYVGNVARNMRLFAELERILGPLRRAGIPVILLKGAAMTRPLFGDIGLRHMGDLDVLVPVDARQPALAVLRALGYHLVPDPPAGIRARARRDGLVWPPTSVLDAEASARLYERYHFHYYLERDGQTFPLELHWHIVRPGRGGPIDDFWREARPARVGDVDALCFRPEHLLLHLALHLTADDWAQLRLARLVDVHRAVTTQTLDWAWLGHAAERQHAARALGVALGLARRVLGTAVPTRAGRLDGFDGALLTLLGRRWMADLRPQRPERPALEQSLAWAVARRDRWGDVAGRLYRLFAAYPETNPRLPERYRGSEVMNFLAAVHPSRIARLRRRGPSGQTAGAGAALPPVSEATPSPSSSDSFDDYARSGRSVSGRPHPTSDRRQPSADPTS
jgi:Uncharacterised nucleotidyltransferase